MATYRNKQDDTIPDGSEFKLNVNMEPIDGYHMKDVDFFCTFKSCGRAVNLTKSEMIEVNDDNYLAPLYSSDLGIGTLSVRYEADIPDDAFDDGYRHIKIDIPTKISIV